MSDNLVIVESPAKAKTIARYLGKGFTVKASMGHVRDLPKSQMGIDVEHDFEPSYAVTADKKKVVADLKKSFKKDTILWMATDDDREGEAIGWHLLAALKVDPKKTTIKRIVFHEITKSAIEGAMEKPRSINQDLVDAQQARRILDRLVGYELSPLLWKKIRYGLSAGRVQSVAVRLIVDREREIQAFVAKEYWSIKAIFTKSNGEEFVAELFKIEKKKFEIDNGDDANAVVEALKNATFDIAKVEEKTQKRNPAPPFITSTLQQEASRKLGYSVKRTMMLAQQLYEGLEINGEPTALITYMRTDSVNLSQQALAQAKEVITSEFGKDFALETPRLFKSKKNAQEAHEAIRPVDLSLKPEALKGQLAPDLMKIYELIWKRTLACQMKEAQLSVMAVDVAANSTGDKKAYTFRANGQRVVFAGFMRAYVEGSDDPEEELQSKDRMLPVLVEGEKVDKKQIDPEQHFTKPPARYTEASLVKKLEEEGIGRPSTYAPTISTVIARGYIEKEQKQLKPTDLAFVVTDMLVAHFSNIVDYKFTAEMEDSLDAVAEGQKKWVPLIRDFYTGFHDQIVLKEKTLKKEDLITDETEEICDQCSSKMIVKLGRFGKFLSCSNYPECKNAKPMEGGGATGGPAVSSPEMDELKAKFAGKVCDKCGEAMEVKKGRFGYFLGCSGYPKCKNIQSIISPIGVKCPDCGGDLVEKRTKKGGRLFFGCSKYPKCKHASWEDPRKKKEEE